MASEIRVNTINNRSGLGTITLTDTGAVFSGITTISDLRTSGTSVVAAGTTAAPSISPTGDSNTGIFFPSADTIAFAEGGAEALRIDSSGRVGIGTDNPTQKVEINNISGGTSLLIRTSPTTSGGNLLFGDDASDSSGRVSYVHSSDYMYFSTAGTERLRITSAGSLSAYTTDTGGHRLRSSSASSANLTALEVLNSATSTTDGTVVARIRTNGDIQTNGNIILSTSGAGIDFSANSNAAGMTSELLDDYEEGTWTCSFNGVIGTTTGYYTKIGNLVHIQVYGAGLNVQFAVAAQISGLPFTVRSSYSVGAANHNTYSTNGDNFYFSTNNTVALFYQENTITQANVNVGNPRYVMMAGSYITD